MSTGRQWTYFGDFMMMTVKDDDVLTFWWQNHYVVVLTNLPIGDYFNSSFFQFSSTFLISTRSDERSKNDKTPNKTNLTRTHWSVYNRSGHFPGIPGLYKFQFCHGHQLHVPPVLNLNKMIFKIITYFAMNDKYVGYIFLFQFSSAVWPLFDLLWTFRV